MDVLRKVNKLRLERGWSVYRLSVKSGISQSTLTNMFNRETQPSLASLELICNAFEISLSEFFADDSDSRSTPMTESELIKQYKALPETLKVSISNIIREYNNK